LKNKLFRNCACASAALFVVFIGLYVYYFNATPNDRNLEWDTKKNLFGNLPPLQTPREP